MKYRFNKPFLEFKEGQEVEDFELPKSYFQYLDKWLKEGHLEIVQDTQLPKQDLDFNRDGRVDKKDTKLAATLMAKDKAKKKKVK